MDKRFACCLLFIGMILSCDDILEKDISKKKIILKTPSDEYSTMEHTQLFWWENLDGATAYDVLIVTPNIENPITLMLDSAVTVNRLQFTLPVGEYEWCVRGTNGGYSTEYVCRKLNINE